MASSPSASLVTDLLFSVSYTIASELRASAVAAGFNNMEVIACTLLVGICLVGLPAVFERLFDVLIHAAFTIPFSQRLADRFEERLAALQKTSAASLPGSLPGSGSRTVDGVDVLTEEERRRRLYIFVINAFGRRRRRLERRLFLDEGEVIETLWVAVFRSKPSMPPAQALRMINSTGYGEFAEKILRLRDEVAALGNEQDLASFVAYLVAIAQRIVANLLVQIIAATVTASSAHRGLRILSLFSLALYFVFLQSGATIVVRSSIHSHNSFRTE